jgi:hypothetical protein
MHPRSGKHDRRVGGRSKKHTPNRDRKIAEWRELQRQQRELDQEYRAAVERAA